MQAIHNILLIAVALMIVVSKSKSTRYLWYMVIMRLNFSNITTALCVGSDDVGLEPLVLSHQGERTEKEMPASAPVCVGKTWLLEPSAP